MLEKIPKCKKCGISETRINGYCSSRCEELAEYDEKISDMQSKLDTAVRSRDGWEQDALLRAKNLDNLKQSVKDAHCENCKWWNKRQTTLHGTCNNEMWFRKTWCDPEGMGIVTGAPVYATGKNFGCNQWEAK